MDRSWRVLSGHWRRLQLKSKSRPRILTRSLLRVVAPTPSARARANIVPRSPTVANSSFHACPSGAWTDDEIDSDADTASEWSDDGGSELGTASKAGGTVAGLAAHPAASNVAPSSPAPIAVTMALVFALRRRRSNAAVAIQRAVRHRFAVRAWQRARAEVRAVRSGFPGEATRPLIGAVAQGWNVIDGASPLITERRSSVLPL